MNRARLSVLGQAARLTAAVAFGLLLSTKATAQWLPDRAYSEGPGIRVGELELHPGIAVRGGYDNNVFRADGKTRAGVNRPLQGAGILAVTPHLFLTTETAQRAQQGEDRGTSTPRLISFRGGLSGTYYHYFLDNAPRNVGIDTDLFLSVAEGRPVGLQVGVNYLRSISPFTQNATQRNAYVFDQVDPTLRLTFSSKSKVLSGYIGYAPKYRHYESSVFNYLNNIQHGADVGAAWRFLPSTALIYDANFAYQDYLELSASDQQLLLFSNGKLFRNRLGVNGALTDTITLRVLAGYAVGFINNRNLDDFEDGIGEATLGYAFGPHSMQVGYRRDISPSALGSYYQTDGGFANVGFLFARQYRLVLEGGVAHAKYGRMIRLNAAGDVEGLGTNGDRSRDDIRADGAVRAEYRATNWLAFMADFTVQSVITDFDYAVIAGDGQLIPDPAGFTTLSVFGGVRASY